MVSDDLLAATRPRRPRRTDLDDLATWLGEADATLVTPGELAGTAVTGLSLSSQRILPGDVYAALPGARAHGVDFAPAALAAGAVAILTDPSGAERAASVRRAAAGRRATPRGARPAGLAHHGNPAAAMRMIGVTGTQGKTTTTRLAEGGLQRAGVPAGRGRHRRHPRGRRGHQDRR